MSRTRALLRLRASERTASSSEGPRAAGLRAVPAALPSARPLNPSARGCAACRASFLKRISSSRSLTTEALIKAQINFCQGAR